MPIDSNDLNWRRGEGGFTLCHGRRTQAIVRVVQDSIYPNMWRAKFADGSLSDMVNLTRAKDAGTTHALALLNQKTITRRASGRPLKRFSGHPAITSGVMVGAAWMLARQADQWSTAPVQFRVLRSPRMGPRLHCFAGLRYATKCNGLRVRAREEPAFF
jgi:hypothetical protein